MKSHQFGFWGAGCTQFGGKVRCVESLRERADPGFSGLALSNEAEAEAETFLFPTYRLRGLEQAVQQAMRIE